MSTTDRWRDIVLQALTALGGKATLKELYELLEHHPRTKHRDHWCAKVRQQLEASPTFVRVGPGVWSLAEQYGKRAIGQFERARRKQYPRRAKRKKR